MNSKEQKTLHLINARLAAKYALLMMKLALFFASTAILAQPANTSFIELYKNYENAGYVVSWVGQPEFFAQAQSKIGRYDYLIMYSSEQLLKQNSSPTLRFGFFKSQEEANNFIQANRKIFPGLKIDALSKAEHSALFTPSESSYFWLRPNTARSHQSIADLTIIAKEHYVNKEYEEALKYYAVLALAQDDETAVTAGELMAVCYQHLHQPLYAMQLYRALLETYPEAKDSSRVRITQRLRALETAASDEKSPLRKGKGLDKSSGYLRGMIAQSYNQMSRKAESTGADGTRYSDEKDVLKAVMTHFDIHAGRTIREHKLELRLNGFDHKDILEETDDGNGRGNRDNSKRAIKRMYLQYQNKELGLNVTGGRQKDFDSGIYTSFDGASVRYSPVEDWTVGLNLGVPVYFSDFADYMDREVYSLFGEYEPNENWKLGGYFTGINLYGETERAAVGAKIHYISPRFFSALSIDYDTEFQEMNIVRWTGTLSINQKSQFTTTYGYHRTPFLSASNIQIGQPYLDVESYIKSESFDADEMIREALARTSVFEYGSLSYKYRVDEDLQIITDVYHSLSTEVVQFLSDDDWQTSYIRNDDEYYSYTSVGVQAVAQNFFGKQDTAILSFRHNDTTLSSSSLIQLSERLRINRTFYLKPRLMLQNQKRKGDEDGKTKTRASLALLYKPIKTAQITLEAGNEILEAQENNNQKTTTYFIVGYQARF